MVKRPRLSRQFRVALKLADRPAYRIAVEAGVNPSTLSKLLCGIEPVRHDDPRVIAVGAVLGIPSERCFTRSRSRRRIEAAQ